MQLCSKLLTIVALLASITLLAPAQSDPARVLLEAAMKKEVVDGDLNAAIQQYKSVVSRYSNQRAVVADALIRMAECYQKLGDSESRKIYERVLRDYADQRELAAEARTRLAALSPAAGAVTSAAMTARRVWAGPEVDNDGPFAPSPDGRYLSYTNWETGDLMVRDIATGEKRRLTNKGSWRDSPDYAYRSTFSPDGRLLAYGWCCSGNRWELRLISVDGGPEGAKPRVIYSNEDVPYLQPTDWSSDGKHILTTVHRKDRTNQLVLISAADGSVRVLKTLDWRWPSGRFSPDGRYIAYDFPPKEDSPDRDIFVLATDGSRETPLVEHPGNDYVLGWAPDGKRILFASERTGSLGAWVIPVAEGRSQGPPELVKGDIGRVSPLGFTRKGAFYYGLHTGMQDVYIATLDMATGKIVAPPTPASQRFMGANSSAAWSPDGRSLAYLSGRDYSGPLYGPRVICIRSLETGLERQLSANLSTFFTPIRLRWSPDGRSLLASAEDNKGRPGLYRIDAQTGEVAPVVQGSLRFPGGVWSNDGKAIFYVGRASTSETFDIRVRDLETGREKELYRPASRSHLNNLALSPDGRWLAFGAHAQGAWEAAALLVMPAAGGDAREVLKVQPEKESFTEGSITAVEWTRDGSQLLFSRNSELWRIPLEGGPPQKFGLATVPRMASLSVHPDGRRIALTAGEQRDEVWVMENLLPQHRASR